MESYIQVYNPQQEKFVYLKIPIQTFKRVCLGPTGVQQRKQRDEIKDDEDKLNSIRLEEEKCNKEINELRSYGTCIFGMEEKDKKREIDQLEDKSYRLRVEYNKLRYRIEEKKKLRNETRKPRD